MSGVSFSKAKNFDFELIKVALARTDRKVVKNALGEHHVKGSLREDLWPAIRLVIQYESQLGRA
jgi:hypothetical protein